MKQPIVIDFAEVESIFNKLDKDVLAGLTNLVGLVGKLKDFHAILISEEICNWPEACELLKQKVANTAYVDMINQLFSGRNLSFIPVAATNFNEISEPLIYLAKMTPDKLLLGKKSPVAAENSLKVYNQKSFIDLKELKKPDCVLFRLPRQIRFREKQEVTELSFLRPYLREANQLEFIDKYLFVDDRFRNDIQFIQKCLTLAEKVKKINFTFLYSNDIVTKQKQKNHKAGFEKDLKKCYPGMDFVFSEYDSKREHDRFIIVNNNEFTMRFSNSFNNLMFQDDKIIVNKSFVVDIDKGRDYSG